MQPIIDVQSNQQQTLSLSLISIKVLHHHQGTRHVMHDPLQQEAHLSPIVTMQIETMIYIV